MNTAIRLAWRKAGTLLFLIFIIISSCQKEEPITGLSPIGIRQGSLLGESKTYFQREVLAQAPMGNDGNLRHQVSKTPLWDLAEQVQLSIGPALKVPLSYDPVISIQIGPDKQAVPLSQLSYLLIYKDSQQVQHAEVVTKIPDLLNQASFSGIILVEDWWGRPIKTIQKTADRHYFQLSRPVLAPGPKGEGPANNAPAMDDCRVVVTEDEFHMYNVEYICPDRRGGGGGGHDFPDDDSDFPRGGGQSPGPGDYDGEPRRPHGGGGGGGRHHQEEPPRPNHNNSDIINNLPEGCLKNVVNELIQKDCKNELTSMINQIFNVSSELDLFIDGRSSFSNDIDGDASTLLGADGYCKINIDLNITILSEAAKEYIAATMFHESIHAYLDATSRMSDLDHQIMAELYISKIATAVKELYPSISLKDAEALAWGGLQETSAWESLKNSDPAKANIILQINNNYRNGQIGNVCNPR